MKDQQANKKRGVGIVFKSIFGIVLLLVIFSSVVSVLGYQTFTEALLNQYADGAFKTADAASLLIAPEKIEMFSEKGPESDGYQTVFEELDRLCNSTGMTFIYVIRPDLDDYEHITFVFSTINHQTDFTVFDYGYVRQTTNDDYQTKYRRLYEGETERELVVRDRGYIETEPHITAMVPLKDQRGQTAAILCVQRQMDVMVSARNQYLAQVITVTLILALFVVVGQAFYLHRVFLRPVKTITYEARRFAEENTISEPELTDRIRNRDELGLLSRSIDEMEGRIVSYVEDLTKMTAEKERLRTELSLAAEIQKNVLPRVFPAFPDRREFDLYATMTPAKEVGGDFYDFFLTDEDHLCLSIADVSGKGVPAALMMMSSKIILANFAKMGNRPGKILEAANEAILSGSREGMFMTAWLGILELSTGKLTAACAGHEYPALYQPGGSFELLKERPGLVLGGMEGIHYRDYEVTLQPGARLFLYTDGVSEATTRDNRLFGKERLLASLNQNPLASPKELLRTVQESVNDFVKDAEQFDDLTMLCISYRGGDHDTPI